MTTKSFRIFTGTIFPLIILLTLLLGGCGGGGGGIDNSPIGESVDDGTNDGSGDDGTNDGSGDDGTNDGSGDDGTNDGSGDDGTNDGSGDAPVPTCISTSEGCLTATNYRKRVKAIEETHETDAGFTNQWGLNAINADVAWARIQLSRGTSTAPGTGITLGAIDSGIDTGNPVFEGKTITERFLLSAADEDGSRMSHGTSVASVMVAAPSQQFIERTKGARGIAWGADITMFAVPTRPGDSTFAPISLAGLNSVETSLTNNLKTVIGWSSGGRSLDFVNVSLGYDGIIDMYSKSDLSANFDQVITVLEQSGSSSKTVFVWSASNAHGNTCDANDFPTAHQSLCQNGKFNAKSPQILAGLPARFPELRTHHIAVVAIDRSGSIASFSNRCGIAADSCIAAPGVGVRVAFFGPFNMKDAQRGSRTTSGTSFAAPMVTGGLALMKHFFRSQLSNTELVSRLYATADKSGIYQDSSVYGQGLMDLDAATRPLGSAYITQGNQVRESGIAVDDTSLNLGTAFGDGLTQSFAGQEIAAFDELGAPFWYSLDSIVRTGSTPSVQSRLTEFMKTTSNSREFGIFRPALGALPTLYSASYSDQTSLGIIDSPYLVNDGGHLSLLGQALVVNRPVSDKLSFSLFSNEINGDQAKAAGMEFVSRAEKTPVAFRSGIVSEHQTLLRSSATGAFGRMSGNSIFVGVEGNLQVGSWHLSAGAEAGTVVAGIDEGLLSVKSPMITSAFALRAGRKLKNRDIVTFSLSQPVRIESGRAEYSIPVGRTIEGQVLKVSKSANIEPSGRQLDITAHWQHFLPPSTSGDFRLTTGLSFQPDHNATADPELSVFAGWRLGY